MQQQIVVAAACLASIATLVGADDRVNVFDTGSGNGDGTSEADFLLPECGVLQTLGNWTNYQCTTIYRIRSAGGALSFLGCFFIFIAIWMGRRYRNFNQRLIMWLSIAALAGSFSYFAGSSHSRVEATCTWQAFWITWLDWSILLWVMCITHSLFVNVIRLVPSDEYETRYHALCWGFSFIIALIPLVAGYYQDTGMWCWIDGDKAWARFILWYVPLFLAIIGMFAVNGYVFRKVDDMAKQFQGTFNPQTEAHKKFLKEQVKPLKWYPLVYLLCAIFPFINRVQNWAQPDKPQFWLFVMHSITYPLVGLLNALVYAMNMDEGFWKECTPGHLLRRMRQTDAGSKTVQEYNIQAISSLTDNDEDNDGSDDDDSDCERQQGQLEAAKPQRRASGLL